MPAAPVTTGTPILAIAPSALWSAPDPLREADGAPLVPLLAVALAAVLCRLAPWLRLLVLFRALAPWLRLVVFLPLAPSPVLFRGLALRELLSELRALALPEPPLC
jgi:hypothetical protein